MVTKFVSTRGIKCNGSQCKRAGSFCVILIGDWGECQPLQLLALSYLFLFYHLNLQYKP